MSTVYPPVAHRTGQKLSVLSVVMNGLECRVVKLGLPGGRARDSGWSSLSRPPQDVKGAAHMHCPYCRNCDTRVLDSRVTDDGGAIRRRRSCPSCEKRFSTVEQMQLVVVKRSGATEPFARDKAIAGVRKACKGRPVSEDDLSRLGQRVEDTLRGEGWAEVPANEVGLAILRAERAAAAVEVQPEPVVSTSSTTG